MTPEEAKAQNAVLPIGSAGSTRMARVDIDEFLADNDVTNLFLLALAAMQIEDPDLKGDTEDWWTFYSISGIHGRPAENWANIPNTDAGYCTHGQFVFPTWHRVYIHQFEQAVYCKMKQKANEFTAEPFKTRYAAAAERFRLPYWDPLMPRYDSNGKDKGKIPDNKYSEMRWGLPKILAAEFVHVRTAPDGKPDHKFKNPLYSFEMPSSEVMEQKEREYINFPDEAPYHHNLWLRTLRAPVNGKTNLGDVEDPKGKGLHAKIRLQNQNIGDRMWKLLGRYNDTKKVPPVQDPTASPKDPLLTNPDNTERIWENFASHWGVDPKTLLTKRDSKGKPNDYNDTAVSLESWHDVIHGLLGGGSGKYYWGNMMSVPIAAFDPAFWLHHNNIDRLFAIYQALNPNSYVRREEDTRERRGGHLHSDLVPFLNPLNDLNFYNSADVQDWKGLGFAVPGNKDLDQAGRDNVALYLNKWYDWIAQGKAPSREVLDHWPKDLRPSYALYGDDATPEQPIRIEALVSSGLATQEISTMSLAEEFADLSVVDKPTSYEVAPEYPGLPPGIVNERQTLTYTATLRVKKFAFNGTFNVHLFIGDVDNNAVDEFFVQANEVGFTTVFASPQEAPCANCVQQAEGGLVFQDGIPLSTALYKYLASNEEGARTLPSLEPADVVPFLRDNLGWRVVTEQGLVTDDQRIRDSGLEITVSARVYALPTAGNPLGTYYQSVDIPQITAGKVGGSPEQVSIPLGDLPGIGTQ